MWSSMLWLTSLGYQSTYGTNHATMVANKRNIATGAITFMFLYIVDDVDQHCLTTTEPYEHTFEGWRVSRFEVTALECIWLEDKKDRKMRALYARNLPSSKAGSNQATRGNFIDSCKKNDGDL